MNEYIDWDARLEEAEKKDGDFVEAAEDEAERCENCVSRLPLKHNFKKSVGFEQSWCCVLLLGEENGWVQEVSPNGRCECFDRRADNG